MATIHKKTWPELFEAVHQGAKTCDVRLADFEVHEGDVLVLEEWDPKAEEYTGRKITKRVTHVFTVDIAHTFWPKKEIEAKGLHVMSFD